MRRADGPRRVAAAEAGVLGTPTRAWVPARGAEQKRARAERYGRAASAHLQRARSVRSAG